MLCPNCKKEIADGMQFCPLCGANVAAPVYAAPAAPAVAEKQKKPVTKKWWFWVIIVVALLLLIGMFSGGDDEEQSTPAGGESVSQDNEADEPENNDVQTPAETTTEKTVFYTGDTVEDGDLVITYVSAEEWNGYDEYFGPEDGNKIIRMKFDFENKGEYDVYINSFCCYADDQAAKDYYYGDGTLSTYSLSAGRKTTGYFYFEVPENAEEIEVEYEVNVWTDRKAVFAVDV